jgi:predicted amidophosphoribosyltransferase
MPIREYKAVDLEKSCSFCREGFERVEPMDCPVFPFCPECGMPIERQLSRPILGKSKSSFISRAKSAGLTTYKK